MILWRISLRELKSRPGRALLTLFSIVLGVASVVAVTLATGTARQAFKNLFAAVAGKADLVVTSDGLSGFREEYVAEFDKMSEEFAAVVPSLQKPVRIYGQDNTGRDLKATVQVMGVDPERDRAVRDYVLTEGRYFEKSGETAVDAGLAKSLNLSVGQKVRIGSQQRKISEFEIVGLIQQQGAAGITSAGIFFIPLRQAQAMFKETPPANVVRAQRVAAEKRSEEEQAELDKYYGVELAKVFDISADQRTPEQREQLAAFFRKIDAIHLVFNKDLKPAERRAVQERAANLLPKDMNIDPPAAGSQFAEESMLAPETGLFIASVMSWAVAGFMILNTFFMNVSERRRQLSIMRAVGATRRQILWMLMNEGLLLGCIGTVLGSSIGVVGAYFLTRAMEGLFQTALPSLHLSILPFCLAGTFGIGVSLLATIIPAISAGRVSPLEGMGGIVRTDSAAPKGYLFWIGLTLSVLGGCLMLLAVLDKIPPSILNVVGFLFNLFGAADTIHPSIVISIVGNLFTLAGFVFIFHDVLIKPAVLAAGAALSPVARVESRLARQQLVRRRTRTTLTVGFLFIAGSTVIAIGGTLLDNVQDVQKWYRKTIIGDFFVRVMMPDNVRGETADIPEEVLEQIVSLPHLKRVGSAKFVPARVDVPGSDKPQEVLVVARQFGIHEEAKLDLKEPDTGTSFERLLALVWGSAKSKIDPKVVRQQLLDGEVVVSTVLAQRIGLTTGDEITLHAVGGPRQFKIAALANEYIVSGLVIYMDRGTADPALGLEGANAMVVDVEKEHLAEVEAALQEICRENGIILQSQAQINSMIDGMMSGVIAGQWAILILGFCVSGFGIVNTLTMNVLEQTRELGLLRTVAMTRWQVRKLIFSQASIIAIISLVPAVFFGLCMAGFINYSTLAVTGHPIEFEVRSWLLLGSFMVGFLIVLAAASFPAERAARLDLTEALKYE